MDSRGRRSMRSQLVSWTADARSRYRDPMMPQIHGFGATEADHRSGYASAMKRFQEHAAKLRASIAAGQCDTKSFGSMSVALGEAGGHSLSIEANDLLAEVQAVGKTAADLRLQL